VVQFPELILIDMIALQINVYSSDRVVKAREQGREGWRSERGVREE
jgi:hypothetical protein